MKKLFKFAFILVVLSVTLVISAFADASGEMQKTYNGGIIVNNTWEYVSSEKTLYIRSKEPDTYNETGKTSYDEKNNAWGKYINEIEHVVLIGNFDKCSGGAFKNHTALKDIRITDDVQQFDGSCFEGCKNLQSITVEDNEHIIGYADLSNASILRGDKHFYGTKITTAFTTGALSVVGKSQLNDGATIYAPKNSKAYEYFSSVGLYKVIDSAPVEISITVGDRVYKDTYTYGSTISFPVLDGAGYVLFSNKDCTEICTDIKATKDMALYGKPLLEAAYLTVRSEDHHGLRMVYQLDNNALPGGSEYRITEFGALSIKQKGLKTNLDMSVDEADKVVVYKDGKYSGSLSGVPVGGITEYACTAVGYERDGKLSLENAEQNLLFRGYAIVTEMSSGKNFVCYTDIDKFNLADGCKNTLEKVESEELTLQSSEELAFIKAPLEAGVTPNYIYTKEELLSTINKVYNDETHYIPAQHLSTSATAISSFLENSYEASGAYPALVALDLMDMTTFNERTEAIIEECKEYISMGGIVSFSYHMENPTGNYTSEGLCRGELGGEDKWVELMTKGTALNTKFNTILDYAGIVLKEFDKEGYPVIWRPLHENNGGWFWWCAIQTFEENGKTVTRAIDQDIFVDLWRYVYDYYTDVWGLKHVVWAYSPNVTNSNSPMPVMYGYPGDKYCDIAGTDWYTSGNYEVNGSERCYKTLMVETKKPAALTEFGPSGSLRADITKGQTQNEVFGCKDELALIKRMMSDGLKVTYVLNWSGSWSMLSLGDMDVIMHDESALDLYEIKAIFNAQFHTRK